MLLTKIFELFLDAPCTMSVAALTGIFSPADTVGDLKKLIAAQTGTRADKIVLKKWSVC